MTKPSGRSFDAKARWHREQRALTPREKIRILIGLQTRKAESDRIRASLGRPVTAIRPWETEA